MFIRLLISIVNASNHVKRMFLSNQKCMTQEMYDSRNHKCMSQELHYYPISVKLDRCVESCNTLNDLPKKVCVPNKTGDLNL